MSKNFELLQEAGIWLGNAPTPTTGGIAVEATNQPPAISTGLTAAAPAIREESLKLVQRLFLTPGQAAPKAVMFAAIDSKNGCSWLCAVIAGLLAQSVSGSVCLVEGNLRTASLTEALGAKKHNGLADALRQEGSITGFAKQLGPPNLWLLSSGTLEQDSLNLLSGDRMKKIVRELRGEFDYLVVDTPPLNAYADAMVLSRLTDGVVLVLEAHRTRREAALRVTESLRSSGIQVLGAVLNNRTFPIPAALYKRL